MITGPLDKILEARRATHGDFAVQGAIAQDFKDMMRRWPGWAFLNRHQRESLDMIQHKIARILSGNPNVEDHWDDIAGYATIAKKEPLK